MKQQLNKKQAKRVEIVKDALEWIKPSKVKSHNTYVRPQKLINKILEEPDSKKVAKKLQKVCEVCAKGALLLSTVALHNDFNFCLYNTREHGLNIANGNCVKRMEYIFPESQLDLMELAFETNISDSVYVRSSYSSYLRYKASKFGSQYKKDIDRLRAIFNNVIENNGTFKP